MSCYHGTSTGNKSVFFAMSPRQRMGKAKIRVVHNVAKGPAVDVFFNDRKVLASVPYKAVSDYLEVPTGPASVVVRVANDKTVLMAAKANLAAGTAYTAVAHGDVSKIASLAVLLLTDNLSCPAPRKAHVRFVHAAATVPAVDIYANGVLKVFSNVAYGKTGTPTYLPVDAGAVELDVTPAGSNDVALGPLNLNLQEGQIYTIIASGLLNDSQAPLTALVTEDSKGMCVVSLY